MFLPQAISLPELDKSSGSIPDGKMYFLLGVMMWILVALISMTEKTVITGTETVYQAEENDIVIIRLDIQTEADVSLINIICFFLSKPAKVLYHMVNGDHIPESQDQKFAGRVQFDREALREAQIRLHVSRVTVEDSGNYSCDLAVYDKITEKWAFKTSEHFVLNVTQTSSGENGDKKTAGVKNPPEGLPQKPRAAKCDDSGSFGSVLAAVALGCLIAYGAYVAFTLLQR